MIDTRRVACALLVLVAAVATTAASAVNAQTVDSLHEANGISYVSGGIGAASREGLAVREKSFNFKLVMTLEGSGTFVSDAVVTLASADGRKLVEHLAHGPLFLAGLPAATYVVTATFRNQTRTRTIQMRGNQLHTVYMRWPADAAQEDVTLPWDGK